MIPRVLHQTWKTAVLPPDLERCARTWRGHHPHWEHRLWTDEDNRALVAEHYPSFLPIYDGYPSPIMRADAARYLILHRHGGIYADLDFEALRPLDPLLEGREVVLGVEPPTQAAGPLARERQLTQVVANAFLASEPGHPFWEHVLAELQWTYRAPSPLDATGPFFLTHALESYAEPARVFLAPAEQLYPIHNEETWDTLDEPRRAAIRETAFAVHHWKGSWWREAAAVDAVPARVAVKGRLAYDGPLALAPFRAARAAWPLVSCIAVPGDVRDEMVELSLRSYVLQTYERRELIVVDRPGGTLAARVAALRDPSIRVVEADASGVQAGVAAAQGDLIAVWAPDVVSGPTRLEVQAAATWSLGLDACVLGRRRVWRPLDRRTEVSTPGAWPDTLVCARSLAGALDAKAVARAAGRGRVGFLDAPALATWVASPASAPVADLAPPEIGSLADVFRGLYANDAWGGGSGPGSRPEEVGLYLEYLQRFLRERQVRSIVDCGCGDWQLLRTLDLTGVQYLGLDLVPTVIERNREAHARPGVEFRCADFTAMELPAADLMLCKDALQHLPDARVQAFLAQLGRFRYALLTNDAGDNRGRDAALLASPWHFAPLDLTQPPFGVRGEEVCRVLGSKVTLLVERA